MPPERPRLPMFFYGTLQRGQRNHDAFCAGALGVQPATVPGRLYELPAGYPALVVPDQHVLATGTSDPLQDARTAHLPLSVTPAAGPTVAGELYAFDDPEARLPALDRLEGFHPEGAPSEYHRVLLRVVTLAGDACAWTYIQTTAAGTPLPAGRWP